MRVKSKLGLRLAAVGVVVGAAGLPLVGATAAHAVTGPALTATPNTGLNNGDTTTIAGTGFGASSTAYVVECSGLTGSAACDSGTLVTKATDATGAFSVSFPVEEGTVGNGSCYPGDTCYIAVTTDPANPSDTAQASATTITFAAATAPAAYVTPSTGLTNGTSLRVVGVGFTASHDYSVVECSGLTGAAACDATDATGGETDAKGNLTTTFAAKTGTIGNGTCAAGSSNCYLIVDADPGTASDTSEVSFVNLKFAAATTAPGPKVVLSASKNLKNGQTIKVSGSGFPQKGATLYVVECSSLTKGSAYCDTSALAIGATSKTGTFSGLKFTIATGSVFAKSGAKGACGAGATCYVVASTSTTGVKADAGGAAFTIAKASPVTKVATSTSAKKVKGGIEGAVKAKGSGVSGLKVTLELVKGKKVTKVKSDTTGKKGVYAFKVTKAGKYIVVTASKKVGTKDYLSSSSKSITIS